MGINSKNYGKSFTDRRSDLTQTGLDRGLQMAQDASSNEDKLAALIKGKQMDRDTSQAQITAQHAADEDTRQAIRSDVKTDFAEQDPKNKGSISGSKEGYSMMQAPPVAPNANQEERNRQMLIKRVTDDYNKQVGTSPKRILAAQAVMKALDSGDITTLGRIKAQLPVLEGENYKPTDAERELILNNTAEGGLKGFLNKFGGDNAAVSAAQVNALRKFVKTKLDEEQGLQGRSRNEVLNRWKPHVRALPPDEMDALAGSLGSSSSELLGTLADKNQQANPASISGGVKKAVGGIGQDVPGSDEPNEEFDGPLNASGGPVPAVQAPSLGPSTKGVNPSAAPADMVSVMSPEGKPGKIPRDKLGSALQRGFKQVQ